MLTQARIDRLRQRLADENISYGELIEIDEAFDDLIESGHECSDDPENAMASDKLDELEAALPRLHFHSDPSDEQRSELNDAYQAWIISTNENSNDDEHEMARELIDALLGYAGIAEAG